MRVPDLDIQDVVGQMTVTVRITRSSTTRVRLWIGARLLKFAGWIIGFNAMHVSIQ